MICPCHDSPLRSSLVTGSKWKMCDAEKGLNSIKKLSAEANVATDESSRREHHIVRLRLRPW